MDLDVRYIYPHPVSYTVPPQIVALVTLIVGNDFAPPAKNGVVAAPARSGKMFPVEIRSINAGKKSY